MIPTMDPPLPRLRRFFERHRFASLVALVSLPLLVLLAVQYSWLVDLERTSSIARSATLESYLGAVTKEVDYHYLRAAERGLELPPSRFQPHCQESLVRFLASRPVVGARRFVVTYRSEFPGELFFFDASTKVLEPAPLKGDAVEAIHLAVASWRTAWERRAVESAEPWVAEDDPSHRVVLRPVFEEEELVGIGGLLLLPEEFIARVLPLAVERALPPQAVEEGLFFSATDAMGRPRWSQGGGPLSSPEVEAAPGFVFRDWRLGLRSAYATPEAWARANFLVNVSLSLALALVLMAALALVLRTASREMKLSRMKSDFVSNVSHELRTPLASIQVFGELLRLGKVADPEKVRAFGEHIENESRGLSRLINNILDFSRIESGHLEGHFTEECLEPLLERAAERLRLRFRALPMELEMHLPATPLPALRIDAEAFSRALSNVLENAVKYSGERPWIRLGLEGRPGEVVVSVADRGPGIPRDQQEKIFERFHRVGNGLEHDVKGCGLGLSIVRHVMEAHGGRVEVESEPGTGSTFRLVLPSPVRETATARPLPWGAAQQPG
jgi:two-component system phosphate regulon sensor histidine kinase PhoR